MDAVSRTPVPVNEPVRQYQPGSHERAALEAKIKELAGQQTELTMTIAGRQRMGAGDRERRGPAAQPSPTCSATSATPKTLDVAAAIDAAKQAAPGWRALSFDDRAAVFLKAADLLAGPWRATAERRHHARPVQDAVPGRDRRGLRADRLLALQRALRPEDPRRAARVGAGTWNRMEYRPLEGFVLAITPFNFTSIAGNLPTAPALLGNMVVWKPSPTQQLSAHYLMRLLEAAGLPPGVINLVTGDGQAVSRVALSHPDLAGIHFTGSTATFQHLWRTVGENIARYRNYPRLVGETGGKDFVIVHPSADPAMLAPTLIRGAFEYQGQKCSAASRAYVPESIWNRRQRRLQSSGRRADDGRRVRRPVAVHGRRHRRPGLRQARQAHSTGPGHTPSIEVLAGGTADDTEATSSGPPCWPAPIRPTRSSPPSTSARSWPSTSTRTPTYEETLAQAADAPRTR